MDFFLIEPSRCRFPLRETHSRAIVREDALDYTRLYAFCVSGHKASSRVVHNFAGMVHIALNIDVK